MSQKNITVAIFTKDRPKYLKRQLEIFKNLGFDFQIFILDGSADSSNKKYNSILANDVGARHFHEQSLLKRYLILDQELQTEYVAYCTDDDLINPDYYLSATSFLENNPDYSVAVGRLKAFAYRRHRILKLRGFSIEHLVNNYDIRMGDFIEKINKRDQAYLMGCPPTFYGVRRASVHRLFAKYLPRISSYSGMERLESILNLTEGGITVIDCQMGFRDYSAESSNDPERDDPLQYIGEDDIRVLKDVISERLSSKGVREDLIEYAKNYAWVLPLRQNVGRYLEGRSSIQIYFNEIYNQFISKDSLMKSIIKNNKELINIFNN